MNPPKHRRFGSALFCVFVLSSIVRAQDSSPNPRTDFFETRIRPVLVEHCYPCHSSKAKSLKGGLLLDRRETLRRGGDSGVVIVPGKPDQSLLIEALRYESLEMPPTGKLPDGVIADLVQWVRMGAPDPRTENAGPAVKTKSAQAQFIEARNHWAFQPIRRSQSPKAVDTSWPLSPVDAFILVRLERDGLRPAKDADRYTWLRRVSFDLTGLPPTVDEIQQFQQDASPRSCEKVVDRLLASRAFGERWARHWLDLVGYADQMGTSNNLFAEHGWRYRDYVIESLNNDKPFDRFIQEQIAGDLLPYQSVKERAANLTATGFLVLGDIELVEADKAKLRVDIVDRQVEKVSKAFLSMTIACARCHDHKFDPIPQRDYYAIAGFFHSTTSVFKTQRGVWSDVISVEMPETTQQKASRAKRARRYAEKVSSLKNQLSQAARRKSQFDDLLKVKPHEKKTPREKLIKEQNELAVKIGRLNHQIEHAEFFAPSPPKVHSVRDQQRPGPMRITIRGNPRALGEPVRRGFLQVISRSKPAIPSGESGRKQLADWIASPGHPLTARVAVNRIWQKLFGEGLAPSVDYFGLRGEKPSHPDLLDYLAGAFTQKGWSVKRLIRLLVLSRAYRLSCDYDALAHQRDPQNRLLWRRSPRRLDAEAIRDAMLSVSGKLHISSGGPAMPLEYPENVANINPKNVNPPSFSLAKYRPQHVYQRTIYLPVIRSGPQPGPGELRNVFDFTQPAEFAGNRPITAVPTQALFLLNSSVVKKYAQDLADRIENECSEEYDRLELLWLTAFNRPITSVEREQAESFILGAGKNPWVQLCRAVLASNEFLMRL